MGNIMLLKEEYNNLRGVEIKYWDEGSMPNYFCKECNGKICITKDKDGQNVVAQFNTTHLMVNYFKELKAVYYNSFRMKIEKVYQ